MRRRLLWLVFVVLAGCAGERTGTVDAGVLDAGADVQHDASADAGPAMSSDAGSDAGPVDAGAPDAAAPDAGADAGSPDAGTDAGPPDAGMDAGPPDAGMDAGPPDSGPPDAGPPQPPDPATCPVGDADGCCPLALRHGGADPDCAPLDCVSATLGEPIVLEAPGGGPLYAREGTAAVSWTGRDLLIAWAAIKDASAPTSADLWVQRRDPTTGALVRGQDFHTGVWSGRFASGVADIAWAPAVERSLFAAYGPVGYGGAILDAADTPVTGAAFGASCNGFHQPLQVVDTGDRFFVTQMTESCGSPTNPTLQITPVAYDGTTSTPIRQPSISRLGLASAYDPVGRRILMLWKETFGSRSRMRGRFLDVDTLALGEPFWLPAPTAGVDQIRAAFDGQRFGILYSRYASGSFTTSFMLYDPATGTASSSAGFGMRSGRRYAQGAIAWTGDGWAVLITTVESSGTSSAPGATDDPELWLWRLRADGTHLQSRRLDEEHTNVRYPDIAYAGGRVALTWTRTASGAGSQHVLALLSCE